MSGYWTLEATKSGSMLAPSLGIWATDRNMHESVLILKAYLGGVQLLLPKQPYSREDINFYEYMGLTNV